MNPQQALRTPVDSSVLGSITYFPDATLQLEFCSGAIYRYVAVPCTVFQGLIAAESKGTYFNRHIRNRFPYQRLA